MHIIISLFDGVTNRSTWYTQSMQESEKRGSFPESIITVLFLNTLPNHPFNGSVLNCMTSPTSGYFYFDAYSAYQEALMETQRMWLACTLRMYVGHSI